MYERATTPSLCLSTLVPRQKSLQLFAKILQNTYQNLKLQT